MDKKATIVSYSLPEMWHLLSLDAPLVAVVWTCLLGWSVDATPTLPEVFALALAVWILYALDRLFDAARGKGKLEDRHHFHRKHWHSFVFALGLAIPLESWIVLSLPHNIRLAWMLLGVPLVAYLLIIHLTSLRLPKEFVVALFFAAACVMPAALLVGPAPLLTSATLFSLLCWTNCLAIARWERDGRLHPMTEWAARHLRGLCFAIVLGAVFLFLITGSFAVSIAAAASAFALWAADVSWGTSGPRLRMRVLADAVLLTPVVLIIGVPTLRQHTLTQFVSVLPLLHRTILR